MLNSTLRISAALGVHGIINAFHTLYESMDISVPDHGSGVSLPTVYTTISQLLSGFCQHGLISNQLILDFLLPRPQRDMYSEVIFQPMQGTRESATTRS